MSKAIKMTPITATKLAAIILDVITDKEFQFSFIQEEQIEEIGKLIYEQRTNICSCTPNFKDLDGVCEWHR